MGQALGAQVEYRHRSDKRLEAIYSYRDENRKLVKQVLRYPGKRFSQRRPADHGGWIPDISGVKPILYNLPLVRKASMVCICEGEKDCDNFMSLELHPMQGGSIAPTTSGGADSWVDELADELRGKLVVLMPDDDEPGKRFAEKVAASLDLRGIEYRTVTFGEEGAKDLSEFLEKEYDEGHFIDRVGADWLSLGLE